MEKHYLFSPGPTPVPPNVLREMSRPIIHHRTPEFEEILCQAIDDLKYVFQTQNDVIIFASSGTGGMEAAVSNFLSKGDKAISVRGGKFGERWSEICENYGVDVENIDVEWGEAVDPQIIANILKNNNRIKAVFTQACETSTGVAHDIKTIAETVKSYPNTLMVVDAITALGVYDIPTDKWGLDVVITGSQKALMLPPGLAMVSVSKKAWEFYEKSDLPKFYFDLKKERDSLKKKQSAYTPAVSMIMGLKEALSDIKKEGLKKVFERHERLARATRAAMEAIGLELFAKDNPSNSVTAVKVPDGIDGSSITKILSKDYGITIVGGQSQAKGKIFRISHMGYVDAFDILTVISAVEMVLKRLGYDVSLGKGVGAAQKFFIG
ncbi:MAG TPA: alanine--glyoxylate aminotransferase family protein [Nitrospinota bacterium]|nr:alanine--glyoxylate aminotransferase family protein [Nitrospinota bacterium]